MAFKRSGNSTRDELLDLLGSEERQFVELGRQLELDDLVKGILKLSERLGVEGRKRIIRAFTEHNFDAELEDDPQDGSHFRNDCFEYGLPYASSPNYTVKLYWWDREKLNRQYIGTIPFKRDQTIRLTHRASGEVRVVLFEGLFTDRSLFELVPAIRHYRQEEAQKRKARNEARKKKQPLPEAISEAPELGIELRLKQLLPTPKSFVLSYPHCFQNELREDDWQIEILSDAEALDIQEMQPLVSNGSLHLPQQQTIGKLSQGVSTVSSKSSTQSAASRLVERDRAQKSSKPAVTKQQPPKTSSATKPIDPTPTLSGLVLISQLTNAPLRLNETPTQLILADAQNQVIVIFDRTAQQLQSSYSNAELIQLLEKLVKATFRTATATENQKQMATRLRVRLQGAKHQKIEELLNYLMGTPSKPRRITFDDRSHVEGRTLRSE